MDDLIQREATMDTSINADTVYSDCYWTDDRRNAFREAVRAEGMRQVMASDESQAELLAEKIFAQHQTNRRSIAMATKKQQERPVIVTTEHRGVFFGYATDTSGDRFQLKRARMAIYWGTTRGLMELAETGPTKTSKISARADLDVRKVTAVFEVTPEAAAKWEAA